MSESAEDRGTDRVTDRVMDQVRVGDELPSQSFDPITRATLALYAGASGDHNPMHIDIDYARAAGADDVFAHGMLSMAYLARFVVAWRPQARLREFSTRFTSIAQVHDKLSCVGEVTELEEREGELLARVELRVCSEEGDIKLLGSALVAV